jgi:DNA modification methylase
VEIPDEWVQVADDLTPEEEQRFIIEDNVMFGEWDWDLLANAWEAPLLLAWGLDFPTPDEPADSATLKARLLRDSFVIPPFSILDTRQGYWQDRKRLWNALIDDKGETREDALFESINIRDPAYYTEKNKVEAKLGRKIGSKEYNEKYYVENANKRMNNGVSVLDPVLSEIINLWFGLPDGKTFDPFAGDSVFGYVSATLGQRFTGIELRPEQVEINRKRVKGMRAKYICADGQQVATHIKADSQDLLFSCPPYFDLEVYSDLPNDASNQKDYDDFIKIIQTAFTAAVGCLKKNRFAVITCGDVRGEDGNYYRFPDHIKDIFARNGMQLYGELIMIEAVGSARIKAGGQMKNRKPVKVHQNVLIFFNGNPDEIKNIYPNLLDYENKTFDDNGSQDLQPPAVDTPN